MDFWTFARGEFQRVTDQVLKQLRQHRSIADHRRQIISSDLGIRLDHSEMQSAVTIPATD